MRGADMLLGVATLVLGGLALYCARGLEQERERTRQMPSVASEPAVAPAEADEARPFAVSADAGTATSSNTRDPGDLAVARYRLSRLGDPQGRAEESARLAGLRRDWEELAAFAGLSADEAQVLATHAVEARLEELRQYHACEADSACKRMPYPIGQGISGEQLAGIVGPEKAARIQAHQAASDEYQFVRFFRELPAAATLGDADAGRFALALAEERRRFEQAAAQAGLRIETERGPYIGYDLRVATSPSEARDLQRKLGSAMQYNGRLYERAAAILPPGPLARFKAIQDAALDAYRLRVEEMEVARAARRELGLD